MFVEIILHLFNRKKSKGKRHSPIEQHRHAEEAPVVVECPFCQVVSVSTHLAIDERTGATEAWEHVNDVFVCSACRQILAVESFENDGRGVLRAKKWTCAKCNRVNHDLQNICSNCKAWHT